MKNWEFGGHNVKTALPGGGAMPGEDPPDVVVGLHDMRYPSTTRLARGELVAPASHQDGQQPEIFSSRACHYYLNSPQVEISRNLRLANADAGVTVLMWLMIHSIPTCRSSSKGSCFWQIRRCGAERSTAPWCCWQNIIQMKARSA